MTSAAQTADWFDDERRKQNLLIAAIVILCLVVALFPRNERRLFDFPDARFLTSSIAAPSQTQLRTGIFTPAAAAPKHRPERILALPPILESDPDIFGDAVKPEWTFTDEPIRFERPDISGVSEMTRRDWMDDRPTGNFQPGSKLLFAGGVPEPETWAMMILGAAAVAYRMRAERAQRLRQRGRARWRRKLVPAP